jgi:hypothetical protein
MYPGTSPSIAALANNTYEIAFNANTDVLWTYSPATNGVDQGLAMMTGTSPDLLAGPSSSSYLVVYQASNGDMWTYNTVSTTDTGMGMKAGTGPSITALPYSGYEMAFQANTGVLWTYAPVYSGTNMGLAMQAGTSPSIVAASNASQPNGHEIAYTGSDGALAFIGNDGLFDTSLPMASGTSPAIS